MHQYVKPAPLELPPAESRYSIIVTSSATWTKYLQYALQRMYKVANEIDEKKEALKEDLASAEAKLACNDTELLIRRCLAFVTSNNCYNNK